MSKTNAQLADFLYRIGTPKWRVDEILAGKLFPDSCDQGDQPPPDTSNDNEDQQDGSAVGPVKNGDTDGVNPELGVERVEHDTFLDRADVEHDRKKDGYYDG